MLASGSDPSVPPVSAASLPKREDLDDDDPLVSKEIQGGATRPEPWLQPWRRVGKLPQNGGDPATGYGKVCAEVAEADRPRLLNFRKTGCCYVYASTSTGLEKKAKENSAWPLGKWGG